MSRKLTIDITYDSDHNTLVDELRGVIYGTEENTEDEEAVNSNG